MNGALEREFDAWAELGLAAPVWWRDDDAGTATPALDRLLGLADTVEAPLALAVIPAAVEASLPERLASERRVDVLVHGYRHRNHAPQDAKKCEFGSSRSPAELDADARAALDGLGRVLPERLPVFVPPWNRIDSGLMERLCGLGYAGLSTSGPRPAARAQGLALANCHLDPIDWRGTRSLVASERLASMAVSHLSQARKAAARGEDPEPLGILTHHLVHDETIWAYLDRLAKTVGRHPGASWRSAGEIFAPSAGTPAVAIGGRNG